MTIEIDIAHEVGTFALRVDLKVANGLVGIFGRSGAGKTTLINIVAGLIRPRHGRMIIDGAVLLDSARGICLPPHKRRIGYVFQDGRLFPHLTVRQNLAYGQRFQPKQSDPEQRGHASLARVIALLGLEKLSDRRPDTLSGGEKQRVAIGRALLSSPRLLLMDEPLASLDNTRKLEILPFIERLRDENDLPILYVSHAVDEVERLAKTVIVLADGAVVACGPTRDHGLGRDPKTLGEGQ